MGTKLGLQKQTPNKVRVERFWSIAFFHGKGYWQGPTLSIIPYWQEPLNIFWDFFRKRLSTGTLKYFLWFPPPEFGLFVKNTAKRNMSSAMCASSMYTRLCMKKFHFRFRHLLSFPDKHQLWSGCHGEKSSKKISGNFLRGGEGGRCFWGMGQFLRSSSISRSSSFLWHCSAN